MDSSVLVELVSFYTSYVLCLVAMVMLEKLNGSMDVVGLLRPGMKS